MTADAKENQGDRFTPGEYKTSGRLVYVLNEDGTNRIEAHVQSAFIRQPKFGDCVYTTEIEALATAKLFAAAPTLLSTLRDMLKKCHCGGTGKITGIYSNGNYGGYRDCADPACVAARKAIADATGEGKTC